MSVPVVDVVLLAVALAYGVAGYRTGFIGTALTLAGFLGGAFLGVALMPEAITLAGLDDQPALTRALVAMGGIALLAIAGQALVAVVAGRLTRLVHGHRVGRGVDGVVGALAAAIVTLFVAWGVTSAVRPALPQAWSRAVSGSRALGVVDAAMPVSAADLFARIRTSAAAGSFPRVFGGLDAEPIAPVTPPDPAVVRTPGLDRARASTVRVVADAPGCGRVEKGSGWVAAPERVVTNAHVVAGSGPITVSSGGTGRRRPASVVHLDPSLDIAVLAVPGLPVPPLPQADDLAPREPAVVAGFPLGGDYALGAARVRQVLQASGSDIYGRGEVRRRVYSLYATVQPGNSGGPLLDTSGRVVGTVFARSMDDATTGYALTTAQTRNAVAAGIGAHDAVETGACTAG